MTISAKKEAKHHLIFYFHAPNLTRTDHFTASPPKETSCGPPRRPTPMDRFKQIETFVTVAAKGSLSAAALAEGVAPAIIGRRIDALEERLGVKLLVRTTRGLTATEAGLNSTNGRDDRLKKQTSGMLLARSFGLLTVWIRISIKLHRRSWNTLQK